MEKPKPKDFGCKGGFNGWPDKESLQRYRQAMSDYQKWLYQNVILKKGV